MDIADPGPRCRKCNRRAHWAKAEGERPKYCYAHKKGDFYVIVSGLGCIEPGCDRIAFFGPPEQNRRMWCRLHASNDDGDLLRLYCSHPDCWVRVSSQQAYCATHQPFDPIFIEKLDEQLCPTEPEKNVEAFVS